METQKNNIKSYGDWVFCRKSVLSVGAMPCKENYNYILDCNSGDYSKQLNIDMKINEGLNIEKIKSIFQKLGKYGEIQILSLGGVETDNGVLQIVPVEAKNQGDWHIPIINGSYLDGQCGQVVLGKDAADALKSKKGKNVSINDKKYNVRGICGKGKSEKQYGIMPYIWNLKTTYHHLAMIFIIHKKRIIHNGIKKEKMNLLMNLVILNRS